MCIRDRGGLSGPAIAPIMLRCLGAVAAASPMIPLVGCGGIQDSVTARAALEAGASAVQIGTAQLHDPTTVARVAAELGEDT